MYKIVAADSRGKRDGKYIEAIGQYNPAGSPTVFELKEERVLYWLKSGAQPTETVRNLLSHKGLMLKHHLLKKGADENKISAELSKWESLQDAKLRKAHDKKVKRKALKKKQKEAEKPAEKKAEKPAEEPAASEPAAEKPAEQPAEQSPAEEKPAE
jgi:small subunit ribosomal protein S16